ncbi:MAG: acetyl/propionyl-CoA carboxylase alpha subunit [Limisphaerales bacterium]|jgi:acetyl/propionyl-CoA carboxylase alpha subunit
MNLKDVLVANRGEIAIRIMRAIDDLGISSTAIYAEDDAQSLHTRQATQAIGLTGKGAKAYLDIDQIVACAVEHGCDAVHPGYGFLSENPDFAKAVEAAGLVFVGPTVETLGVLGNKTRAREAAQACGIPILDGSSEAVAVRDVQAFLASSPTSAIIKAIAGGGGRGMRVVRDAKEVEEAFARASSEAQAAFGNGDVYVEQYVENAKHIEIQIIGDGSGTVTHLGDRECTLQRRHQKLIEIAPSPWLSEELRQAMCKAAVQLGEYVSYRGLGTIEFIVDADTEKFYFMEANARLQVEHTVTEEVFGIDLVQSQLSIAGGAMLADISLLQSNVPTPRGFALQARVNMEVMDPQGNVKPTGGRLSKFSVPSGPGLRTDTYGYVGYSTNPNYDSLLAKVIASSPSANFADTVKRANRGLSEFEIEGVETNISLLQTLLGHAAFKDQSINTQFVDTHVAELVELPAITTGAERSIAGVRVDAVDPLAVLEHGKSGTGSSQSPQVMDLVDEALPDGMVAVGAPMQGTVVSFEVQPGDEVYVGQLVLVMEAMKMEHEVRSMVSGVVDRLGVDVGDALFEGHPLIYLFEEDIAAREESQVEELDLDRIRADLQEVLDRKAAGFDASRPEAVAKRRKTGHRTARENVADLCDENTFVEYGGVVLAGQRRRRKIDDLIANTTGDGMVCGLGQINGSLFGEDQARTMIMSYDYMVLAGTQGMKNHNKKDRLFEIAEKYQLPTVLFAEGGGGRPGDTDGSGVAGLDCWAFTYFARLSGLVPIVGITTGRCFAGNAVLLGCCDVIIATEGSNIGIGGPAMIEGGGLGVFRPEEVGPMEVQVPNGVVDIAVKDEVEAVAAAKKYLSYFQGSVSEWEAPDPRKLRFVVPENRLRYYDMREVIDGIADVGSVLEIRKEWGIGIITSFIRVEGKPMGVIANNPAHLSGAIDSPGADKGTRFMQLCDAFDIPILSLCDCPGIMVGPEIEKTAVVRHAARMFVTSANIDVPLMTIVTRKGYGLGAQAMAGGSFKAPLFTVTWPTGEFGGMGLEGAVKLGYRKELQAIEDPEERASTYQRMVDDMYMRGKAVNMASHFELDEVIDPAESRKWISSGLRSVPAATPRKGKKRPNVDTW